MVALMLTITLIILETCKASTRKSLPGINYFAIEVEEVFDSTRNMIEDKVALCSERTRLIENLKRTGFYLKADNEVHTTRSSNVTNHWCIYALIDPKELKLAQDCNHEHNKLWIECPNLSITLNEIERFTEETEIEQELLDRA